MKVYSSLQIFEFHFRYPVGEPAAYIQDLGQNAANKQTH